MSTKPNLTVVVAMSDIHSGRHTRSYNPDVTTSRLLSVEAQLHTIKSRLNQFYGIDELVLLFLGDFVDGALIYPGQAYEQSESSVLQQSANLVKSLQHLLNEASHSWKKVRVECVPGNHGRGSGLSTLDNFDWMTYTMLKATNTNKHVDILYNDIDIGDDPCMRIVNVYNHRILALHGDQVKSYMSIPSYGISRKALLWNASTLGPFDMVVMGHWHSLWRFPMNRIKVLITGTMVSDDPWALKYCGMESECGWWCWGVTEGNLIEFSQRIVLDARH